LFWKRVFLIFGKLLTHIVCDPNEEEKVYEVLEKSHYNPCIGFTCLRLGGVR